jgi:hypothetical protein
MMKQILYALLVEYDVQLWEASVWISLFQWMLA